MVVSQSLDYKDAIFTRDPDPTSFRSSDTRNISSTTASGRLSYSIWLQSYPTAKCAVHDPIATAISANSILAR